MPWTRPPCTWPSTIIGLIDLADVVDAGVVADLHVAGLGVDLDRTQVRAVREGEVSGSNVASASSDALDAVGQVVACKTANAMSAKVLPMRRCP